MERLTYRGTPHMEEGGFVTPAYSDHSMRRIISKLAEYEEAEESGLLHKTDVAIGQTVYTNFTMQGWYLRDAARPYRAKVVFIGLNNVENEGGGFFNVSYEKLGCMMQFRFSDIGKSVFLTKKEAEAHLQAIREGENNVK